MKLPGENRKKYEEISSGILSTTSQTVDINLDFSKYDKIILEILPTDEGDEGCSSILELDDNSDPINEYINFSYLAYGTSSGKEYKILGFGFKLNNNTFRIAVNYITGWSDRKYRLRGILK